MAPTAPARAPAPSPLSRQPLAPPAADIITVVALASGAPCSPGGECALTSRLNLGPHPSEEIAWEVVAVDDCTGALRLLYATSLVAVPECDFVYDVRTVTLPAPDPLMLYVVSSVPARAASPALSVGVDSCR